MIVRDEPAVVLHRRAYRNTSLIVDCLTPGFGRITLVARGARARKRRTSAAIEPFMPMLIGWQGRGEVRTLVAAEATGGFPALYGVDLAAGLYVNELVLRMLSVGDPHPGVFAAYGAVLSCIVGNGRPLDGPLRRFERALLDDVGFGLVLDRDSEGRPLDEQAQYAYLPAAGPVRSSPGSAHHGPCLAGASLIAFYNDDLYDGTVLKDCKRLTRWVLDHYLDGRPLRSRELLAVMARTAKSVSRST